VSLANEYISENSLEIFWVSQLISRGTCHRHVTDHTTNEYKEQVKFPLVKKRTSPTIVYMECHLFCTCARGHVPRDSQGDDDALKTPWLSTNGFKLEIVLETGISCPLPKALHSTGNSLSWVCTISLFLTADNSAAVIFALKLTSCLRHIQSSHQPFRREQRRQQHRRSAMHRKTRGTAGLPLDEILPILEYELLLRLDTP